MISLPICFVSVVWLTLSIIPTCSQDLPGIKCDSISRPGWSTSFDVCYSHTPSAISSANLDLMGNVYISAVYFYPYNIYSSLSEDSFMFDVSVEKTEDSVEYTNGTVTKTKDCRKASVNGVACSSCSLCEGGAIDDPFFSADCSNVPGGRNVTCESTDPLFLPMTEALFNQIECTKFSYVKKRKSPRKVISFKVCYTARAAAVPGAISILPNGTEIIGDPMYYYYYDLYKNDKVSSMVGKVTIQQTGNVCDFVEFEGTTCTSCSICDDGSFSADCRNIPNGRMVQCESTSPVFYPFNKNLLRRKPRSI